MKFEKSAENKSEFIKKQLSVVMPESSVDVKTKSSSYNVEITTNYLLKENAENDVRSKLTEAMESYKDELYLFYRT